MVIKLLLFIMLLLCISKYSSLIETFTSENEIVHKQEESQKVNIEKAFKTVSNEFVAHDLLPKSEKEGVDDRKNFVILNILKVYSEDNPTWTNYQTYLSNSGNVSSNLAHIKAWKTFNTLGKSLTYNRVLGEY